MSTAGDVNGDGYADVIVGAQMASYGQTSEGRAYMFYGSADGVSLTPAWFTEGDQSSAYCGHAVGPAGDVNGDGYDDVIIGAYQHSNAYTRVYVYYGSASGLSTSPGWVEVSEFPGSSFGYSVSTAGNVNSDGYDDVIVGAPYYSGGEQNEGAILVYLGSADGLGNTHDWLVECNVRTALFGSAVSTAGDMNDDGFADVIAGAPNYYRAGAGIEGRVFAFYGSASGLGATAAWTDGGVNNGSFASSVARAGDVNGDGAADVLVGSPMYEMSHDFSASLAASLFTSRFKSLTCTLRGVGRTQWFNFIQT